MERCEGCWGKARGDPDRATGCFPRGVYFEEGDGTSNGTIVIGLNPGPASTWECRSFRNDAAEPQVDRMNWSTATRRTHAYYSATRALLRAMGRRGPIWWTEAVKCQTPKSGKPIYPIEACVGKHLRRELAKPLLRSWPIVVVHQKAVDVFRYLDKQLWEHRRILVVPHYRAALGRGLPQGEALPALVNACKRHQVTASRLFEGTGLLTDATWLRDPKAWREKADARLPWINVDTFLKSTRRGQSEGAGR